MNTSIELLNSLLCCPQCRADLKLFDNSSLKCTGCEAIYSYDENIIDFQVTEQKFENNWSQDTPQEETEQWVNDLLAGKFITQEDLANIPRDINSDAFSMAFALARNKIQSAYYQAENRIILDLATGPASLFQGELDSSRLAGKIFILADLSKTIFKQVQDRLKTISKEVNFLLLICDIASLPVKNDSVDLATGNAAFPNSDNGCQILAEVQRVLKKGSSLLCIDSLYAPDSRTLRLLDKIGKGTINSSKRVDQSLSSAGFRQIEIKEVFSGKLHLAGDLVPLTGEECSLALISAIKWD